MNKEEAKKLLSKTFDNPFDEKIFLDFAIEFFNGKIDFNNFPAIWPDKTFKTYIESSKCKGLYIDPNEKKIAIITVELKKTS